MSEIKFEALLQQEWIEWRNRYSASNNAREIAYQTLRDKIIFLELKPGEPISDKLLAEQLDMSRTPVREAMILLAATNMVVVKPQVGSFVAPIDGEWIEMEQFSRFALEKEVVRLACREKNNRIARVYRENLDRFDAYEQDTAPDRIRHLQMLDNGFHGIAFEAAGKKDSFFHMLNNMQHIERLRVMSLLYGDAKSLGREHREIAEAIIEGDEHRALTCLEHHLYLYRETIQTAQKEYPEYFVIR